MEEMCSVCDVTEFGAVASEISSHPSGKCYLNILLLYLQTLQCLIL